jgi:hypothetical protein
MRPEAAEQASQIQAIQRRSVAGHTGTPVQFAGKKKTLTKSEKAWGFMKWIASKIFESKTSTYTLREGMEAKFKKDMLGHDAKAGNFKGGGGTIARPPEKRDGGRGSGLSLSSSLSFERDDDDLHIGIREEKAEEKEASMDDVTVPRGLTFKTSANVQKPKGEDPGYINVNGTYSDGQIDAFAKKSKGTDINTLSGEIYGTGAAEPNTLVVNTTYSFPIGMGVGSILMYEGFYQASYHGKNLVREGVGEGSAARHWAEQREMVNGPEKEKEDADEEEALIEKKPKKQDVSVRNGLIYAQAQWKQYWK